MANPIKYSTGSETKALKKGNFYIGTGDVGKGPSDVTGYYQGVDVPENGYTIYLYNENSSSNLSYHVTNNDEELISFTNGISNQSFTSVTECSVYFRENNGTILLNRNIEPIITDGLIFNIDSSSTFSYPKSGNTIYDITNGNKNLSLINSPIYRNWVDGILKFDGVDEYLQFQNNLEIGNSVTMLFWIKGFYANYYLGIFSRDKPTSSKGLTNAISQDGWVQVGYIGDSTGINKFIINGKVYDGNTSGRFPYDHVNDEVLFSMNSDGYFASNQTPVTSLNLQTSPGGYAESYFWLDRNNKLLLNSNTSQNRRYFKGELSNVLIYDRTLSNSEVSTIFESQKWRFAFISVWKTDNSGVSDSNQIRLPLRINNVDFEVDWGDGSIDRITSSTQNEITHTYSEIGTYTVKIFGKLNGFQFNGFNSSSDRLKFIDVKQYGIFKFDGDNFEVCGNLVGTAKDTPLITGLSQALGGCTKFIGDVSEWDVSRCSQFSQTFLFSNLNPNVVNWNMSNATNIGGMFYSTPFNREINHWDISKVVSLSTTFRQCSFNKPLSGWNVSNVTNMSGTFHGCSFNQDISTWNVSKVTTMLRMFYTGGFNNGGSSGITNWDTSKVTDMSECFRGTPFNQPIGSWDTSRVTNMFGMFQSCPFNQDISNWVITGVTNFTNFMAGKSPSNYNYEYYDNLLNSWSQQNVKTGLTLSMGTIKYSSAGVSGRNTLVNTYGWTITDGGPL